MKPAQYPDLKLLIQRLEVRHQKRQATRMVVAGTAVLALIAISAPHFIPSKTIAPVALKPAPTEQVAARDAYANAHLSARAAVVYDLITGKVIYEKNATSQLPLASLTKLITAYAAVSALSLDAPVTISATALAQDGESGLVEGETFTLAIAAKLALVASSNDAAEALSEAASAKQETSNKRLLASAIEAIGLPQTYALNGTGLDESTTISGGYGSALDVAKLAGALLGKAPEIAHATTYSTVSVRSNAGVLHTLPNTNQDVVHVPNLLLSKTGFTDLAGGNLAIVYDAGIAHPVAIVVLGSTREGRFSDVRELLSLTGTHFATMTESTPATRPNQ